MFRIVRMIIIFCNMILFILSISNNSYSENRNDIFNNSYRPDYIDICNSYTDNNGLEENEMFDKYSESHDPQEICLIHTVYIREASQTKNYNEVKKSLEQSIANGQTRALAQLGDLYFFGYSVGQDFNKAKTLYEKSCKFGELRGCLGLGNLYYNGLGVKEDKSKGQNLIYRSIESSPRNALKAGVLYFMGKGVKKDMAMARKLLSRAYMKGIKRAEYYLGVMLYKGWGFNKDIKSAKIKLASSIEKDWMYPYILLALIDYEEGNLRSSNENYKKAQSLGSKNPNYLMYLLYRQLGQYETANYFLNYAASQDDPKAKYIINKLESSNSDKKTISIDITKDKNIIKIENELEELRR